MSDPMSQKKKGCGLCALMFIVLVSAAIVIVLSAVGILRIPWLSQFFSSPKDAVRRIELSESEREKERAELENKIGEIAFLMRTATPENPVDISLTVTERELTALLLSGSGDLPLTSAQAAIHSDGIEVSGTVTQPFEGQLLIKALPVLKDGTLNFDIQEVAIGGLTVPRTFADSLVKTALGKKMDEANAHIKSVGQITHIELKTGELIMSAHVVNGSQLFQQEPSS